MAAYDTGTPSVEEQAKAWIDAVNSGTGPSGGWRLQFIRMRTRRKFGKPLCGDDPSTLPDPGDVTDANGEPVASAESFPTEEAPCPEAPVRIRRFVPGCPWALVDRAIRYLHRIAPYRGIVYNGVRLAGVYRPTLTQWMRDEQAQSPGERGSLGTYTLVQDLVEVTCCGDEDTLGTGGSCQSSEETTYVWDADSVEPLPTSCEQGVTYALRAVSRGEDGSFSYQLVKSVAKTVAWGPVTVSCGPLETVEEWGWRNLYGCPPRSFRADECYTACPSSKGLDTIPADGRCDTEKGVRTEAQWQLNQDCTWDVRVRRRTAKPRGGGWKDGTSCREVSHVLYRNSSGVPDVATPAPGERVSANFRLNDDMTWDGEVSRVSAPDPDRWDWEEGSACRRRSVEVYEDQVERPEPPELSSLAPGETLEANVSRTEDCLWNARFVRTAAPEADEMAWNEGSSCQSVESHRLVNQPSYEGLVPAPAAGERVSADVSRNADCTYDVSYRVQKPYEGADVEWDDGTGCQVRHHTLWIDRAEKPDVGPAGPGETVSASLRFDPSSCTWSGERVVTEAAGEDHMSWTEGSSCRPVESHRLVSQPSYEGLVPVPGPGEKVSADVSRNADCTYDVRYSVTSAYEGGAELSWDDGPQCRRTHHRQIVGARERPEPPGLEPGQTLSMNLRFDPSDCTWSGEQAVTDPMPPEPLSWTEGSPCQPTETEQYLSQPDYRGLVETRLEEGVSLSQRVTRNADCTYDVAVQRTRPQPWTKTEEWWSGGTKHRYTRYGNQPAPQIVSDTTYGAQVSNTFAKSDATCLYDGESREVFDPGHGTPGGDYLWGPEFDGQQVDLLTQVSNADPLGKDIVAQWRVSWYVSGSRNLDDFVIDMRRLESDGWATADVRQVGSYAYGTGESPSAVFRGRIYKVVCIADGNIRRTDPKFKTLAEAVQDAHDKVAAASEAKVGGF